jgi:hypothetical protein
MNTIGEAVARRIENGWQVDMPTTLAEDILTAGGFDPVPEALDDSWVDPLGHILSISEALPVALKRVAEALQ